MSAPIGSCPTPPPPPPQPRCQPPGGKVGEGGGKVENKPVPEKPSPTPPATPEKPTAPPVKDDVKISQEAQGPSKDSAGGNPLVEGLMTNFNFG